VGKEQEIQAEQQSQSQSGSPSWSKFILDICSSREITLFIRSEEKQYTKSILEIHKFIVPEENSLTELDLVLKKDDLIKRFLNYLEYWKEKGASKSSVFFCLRLIKGLIVSGKQKDPTLQDKASLLSFTKIQNFMDQLNTT
jgi:hypothetical protein